MLNYKRLSDNDLLLTIDRMQAEIEGQKLIVAKLVAGAESFRDAAEHQQLVATHILMREMLELDLKSLEVEWRCRQ